MTTDPFLRRHGHGAARLAIGRVEGGVPLGEHARRPVAFEALAASLPGLACVLTVLLIAWTRSPIDRRDLVRVAVPSPPSDQTTLAIRMWREPVRSVPTPPQRLARPVPVAAVPSPVPSPVLSPVPSPAAVPPDASGAFDPRVLVSRASPAMALPTASASSASSASFHPAGEALAARPGLPAVRELPLLGRDFLSSLPATENTQRTSDSPTFDSAVQRAAPRPTISAPDQGSDIAGSILSRRERWQEVPLDDLPDCTPAGRQDALKQQILRSLSFQRECSHPEGRYRFVQTRNLNAFLLWSRPNPNALALRDRDRDACDVLERALRCLGETSNEESSIR